MPARKARKGARKAAPASGSDRIGALPDETLHHVLSFLPAQQAVRTCVLARRWLHLWKSATGLRIVGADGEAPVPFEEVREFVDSLLLLRGSSPLETFELRVAGDDIDVRRVRLWVRRDLKGCPTFNRLKSLSLDENWCVPYEYPLACILEHSPVLQKLSFILYFKIHLLEANVQIKGRFNPNELPSTISSHLKEVEIICGGVDGNVLKVLRFLSKLNISFSFPPIEA